jgi:hypothetical protein
MKNRLLAIALGAALVLFAGSSFGSATCENCTIENITVGPTIDGPCNPSPCALIKMAQPIDGRPSCTANDQTGWHFLLDLSTPSGRNAYVFLLAARALGQPVMINGTHNCPPSGNYMTIEHFGWVAYPNPD